ncbi:MAG: LysR family transcriptional regulator [Caulobacteraceae bacterium]|nr:LysR family transcriptional regulator [Caulobacteraceae bacterium]
MLQFAVVADELSFTKAAQRLNLAQPWLSARIQTLEDEVGEALFERSSRRVALTQAGDRLVAAVRPLSAAVENFEADLRAIKEHSASTVRVGLRATGVRDLMQVRLMDQFEARHPTIKLTVETGFTNSLIDRLQRGKLDFVFAAVDGADRALESKAFSFDRPGLLMRQSDPLSEYAETPLQALDGRRVAVLSYPLSNEINKFLANLAGSGAILEQHRELHKTMLSEPCDPPLLMFRAYPVVTDPHDAEDIVWHPLENAPQITVSLLRRRAPRHSATRENFWKLADRLNSTDEESFERISAPSEG